MKNASLLLAALAIVVMVSAGSPWTRLGLGHNSRDARFDASALLTCLKAEASALPPRFTRLVGPSFSSGTAWPLEQRIRVDARSPRTGNTAIAWFYVEPTTGEADRRTAVFAAADMSKMQVGVHGNVVVEVLDLRTRDQFDRTLHCAYRR